MDAAEATLFANVITIMLNYDCLSVRWWETNILNSYEVAALIVADDFYNPRDIVVDNVSEGLKQISPLHPIFFTYASSFNCNLVVKFQEHINIEWCIRAKSIKYVFKDITKGPDKATIMIEHHGPDMGESIRIIDE
ncbi:LOW QUALITY PROTEIN: hypothetical protein RJ639_004315, partial [Escallonia herrerae]